MSKSSILLICVSLIRLFLPPILILDSKNNLLPAHQPSHLVRWFDSDYILLDDPLNGVQLSVHTQGTPIDEKYIEQLRLKAGNNKYREDGFSMRIDSLIASDLQCNIGDWHREYVGFDKCKLHYQAALLLSYLYKNKLKS